MNKDDALSVIGEFLGPTVTEVLTDGLPSGSDEDLKFDEQLVKDIARACERWQVRIGKL